MQDTCYMLEEGPPTDPVACGFKETKLLACELF